MTDPNTEEYTLLGLLADIRAAAGDREGRLMQPELVEHIRGLKARADQAEQLRAEMDAMKGACIPTREDAERQQWKGVDGAIAFHLIDRHADSWDEAARMMHAWRDANPPAEVEALRADAKASAPPKEKPEFLEWVATELSASGALDRAVAQGVAETLRGQAFLLRAIAARKGEGVAGA